MFYRKKKEISYSIFNFNYESFHFNILSTFQNFYVYELLNYFDDELSSRSKFDLNFN